MFGVDEQVFGRGQSDQEAAPALGAVLNRRGPIMNEPIDLLRGHFGLTPAEARLALHLVAGETLRSAAVKLSITYETARSRLKKIFSKTGTCRQTELVVAILTVFPGCLGAPH